jgi:hypothetical protein
VQAPPPAGWWRLTLLHAVLVAESRQGGAGAPAVQRVVSSSPLPAAPSAALPLPLDGGAPELPPAIQRLVAAHPGVLSADVAARFLVGLGQGDKAYEALRKMVAWVGGAAGGGVVAWVGAAARGGVPAGDSLRARLLSLNGAQGSRLAGMGAGWGPVPTLGGGRRLRPRRAPPRRLTWRRGVACACAGGGSGRGRPGVPAAAQVRAD